MGHLNQYYHHHNINKQEYKFARDCTGLNCKNKATTTLKVKYINKTGYFCQRCTDDLLESELAEIISQGGA